MEDTVLYEKYVRDRITELRVKREISEHRMSLDLGKSGSYIRGITNGSSLPSLRELFNIIEYFDLTPSDFSVGWKIRTLCGLSCVKSYWNLTRRRWKRWLPFSTGSRSNRSAALSLLFSVVNKNP